MSCSRASHPLSAAVVQELLAGVLFEPRARRDSQAGLARDCKTLEITESVKHRPTALPQGDAGRANEVPSLALHRP